ncbi:MAG: hypothetical protein WC635_10910 [Bacteriovorax sp.]|jgi:hypothetical protein
MKNLILCLASLCSITLLSAAEVDHFTRRNEELSDSSALLNQKANEAVSLVIDKLNHVSPGCKPEALYPELRYYFANAMSGAFTKDVIANDLFIKREIFVSDSVYQDWGFFDGASLGLQVMQRLGVSISPLVRVGNIVVGTDKFEHMFGRGYKYFVKNYIESKGIMNAVKFGIFGEKFILGGLKFETGVFSYGDLSANFNGMRFWNHMLQKHDDILGAQYNVGPYIYCKNNQWVKGKDIDFTNYIDNAFDEGINCSKFTNPKALAKFTSRINGMGFSCPIRPEAIAPLLNKYGPLSKWLINQAGNGVLKLTGEFQNKMND